MRRWLRQTSAATLVAAKCMEAAEAMGAERNHLASVVTSDVNVCSQDDITTLTAASATQVTVSKSQLLAKGSELLKRTRNDDLNSKSKVVSVYIHRTGQVMLKIKKEKTCCRNYYYQKEQE
ncbi:hypothetical protein P8452_66872 [Trifolium repens]|nr:hypothetical protein P8452_66872 [Trifolium repens]